MTFTIYGPSLKPSASLASKIVDGTRYHPEPQRRVETYENAVFFPGTHCLYDEDGVRISASRLWRNRRLDNDVWPVGQQAREVAEVQRVYEAPLVYMGVIFPHYGHFILECIARLWALDRISGPAAKLLYSEAHKGAVGFDYVGVFLEAAGIPADRLVTFTEPVRLGCVHVPHPTFFLRQEAYSNHSVLPLRAAAHMLAGQGDAPLSETPAYLSRTKFKAKLMANSRRVFNEEALEDILRKSGFAIYYPEDMTLASQVNMINHHRWIMGTRGSAFHTLLFSHRASEQHICVLYEHDDPGTTNNYYLVDRISGVDGHYLGALDKRPGTDRADGADFDIDIDLTLRWLHAQRVISDAALSAASGAASGQGATPAPRVDRRATAGSIRGHLAFRGDVQGGDDLSIGIRGSGAWIEGFAVEVPGFPLQYRALGNDGTWTAWQDSGSFAGTRGKSRALLGFAVRLAGTAAATHSCRYTGTFGATAETATAVDGEACRARSDAPLETIALVIEPRSRP